MFFHFFFFSYKKIYNNQYFLIGFKPFLLSFDYYFFLKKFKSLYFFRTVFIKFWFKSNKIFGFYRLRNSFNPLMFLEFKKFNYLPTFDNYFLKLYKNSYKLKLKVDWYESRVKKPKRKPRFLLYFYKSKFDIDVTKQFEFTLPTSFYFSKFLICIYKKLTIILNSSFKKLLKLKNNLKVIKKKKNKQLKLLSNGLSFFKKKNNNLNYILKIKLKLSVFPYFFKLNTLILKKYSKFFQIKKLNFFKLNVKLSKFAKFSHIQPYLFFFLNKNISFRFRSFKRLKFKPGYSILWRKQRLLLKASLSFKNLYQKKFTRFLLKFFKISMKFFLIKLEFSLLNIILRSRFFLLKKINTFFINNGFIYLNGLICLDLNMIIFKYDLIQIIVTWKYYYYYRNQLNYFLQLRSKLRFKNFIYNKRRFKKKGKVKSYRLSDWVLKFNYFFEDVPKHIEVDYQTLSIIIIYFPYNMKSFHYSHKYMISFNSIKLYNWKYLT